MSQVWLAMLIYQEFSFSGFADPGNDTKLVHNENEVQVHLGSLKVSIQGKSISQLVQERKEKLAEPSHDGQDKRELEQADTNSGQIIDTSSTQFNRNTNATDDTSLLTGNKVSLFTDGNNGPELPCTEEIPMTEDVTMSESYKDDAERNTSTEQDLSIAAQNIENPQKVDSTQVPGMQATTQPQKQIQKTQEVDAAQASGKGTRKTRGATKPKDLK